MISILAAVVTIIIIERRRSIDEEMMEANRNYLTRIFESIRARIVIVDVESQRIVDASPSALAMMGESKEDCIGKVCQWFISPAESENSPVSGQGQPVNRQEQVLLTTSGARIPVIKSVVPLELDGRPCLLETFVDITGRKNVENNLMNAVQKLKILLVVTRNEIITDLYALEGYIELIRYDLPAM